MFGVYLTVIFAAIISTAAGLSAPFDIRVDYYKVDTTKDLVISTARPRLSWKLPLFNERNVQQSAYQIQLKSDTKQWDSERIVSSQSVHVPFFPTDDLQSMTHYDIRLRAWTTVSDEASAWTDWIHFRTSMFDLHEFLVRKNDDVHWIGSTQIYMNELRKEFNVPSSSPIRTATLFISGVGYYELYLNGQTVDDSRKLDPAWTTFEKRTLFASFDLSKSLKVRENSLITIV